MDPDLMTAKLVCAARTVTAGARHIETQAPKTIETAAEHPKPLLRAGGVGCPPTPAKCLPLTRRARQTSGAPRVTPDPGS